MGAHCGDAGSADRFAAAAAAGGERAPDGGGRGGGRELPDQVLLGAGAVVHAQGEDVTRGRPVRPVHVIHEAGQRRLRPPRRRTVHKGGPLRGAGAVHGGRAAHHPYPRYPGEGAGPGPPRCGRGGKYARGRFHAQRSIRGCRDPLPEDVVRPGTLLRPGPPRRRRHDRLPGDALPNPGDDDGGRAPREPRPRGDGESARAAARLRGRASTHPGGHRVGPGEARGRGGGHNPRPRRAERGALCGASRRGARADTAGIPAHRPGLARSGGGCLWAGKGRPRVDLRL
mmetsp:Transcript_28812/g.92017  ORF Transcript_28812/g.92017 Transcript_28812/m.92017 type:complete len:285 (+) Transcript_28812:1268-2122(+)